MLLFPSFSEVTTVIQNLETGTENNARSYKVVFVQQEN